MSRIAGAGGPGLWPGPLPLQVLALLLTGWTGAAAQEPGTVVGRVLDLQSEAPVPTAEVWVPKAGLSVTTNDLGWFVLPDVPHGEYVIEIGRVGYRTETRVVLIGEQAVSVEVRLDPEPVELPGVQVVQSRRTAAGFEVTRIDLSKQTSSGKAIDLLRRVAGPQFVRGSGEPGSGGSIQLRGPTSMGGGPSEPLVLIDGIATTLLAMQDMPALDVASIEVLRGAAAAAEHGSRGAAGVIIVTTRRGAVR